ncbi:phosphoadenosine phosphosulfate reductase [Chroococcidiopsis sp. CCMEE 29]|uniref:phosphoadenosine phosphosulfate reductase n=1 Tax=Chroococcidiopsis sp. CCMEE 29 TaxID=155894 RepID=UPI0020204A1A|nr:phosphoadenosine phosphosulfate reductase [Chroococcidiopsis sp. CCMEE 29]
MSQFVASENPIFFDLEELNQRFETAHPRDVLAWCLENIPTGLVQSSAFNVNGMVIMHILYQELRPIQPVPVLFLDTLHHFPETLALVHKAQEVYALNLKVYKVPDVDSREAFAVCYGEALWDRDIDKFHQLTKIEPLERGLKELQAIAWITGRRRNQSSIRATTPIFQFDKKQRLKINPLATWTSEDVWAYVAEHDVIYNPLHDQGYPSIGDEPTTTPVSQGEDERAGRWRGKDRSECGMHVFI